MFNWSFALGAWALGGPYWSAVVFLAIALVRIAAEAQGLRHESAALRRRLIAYEGPFTPHYQPDTPLDSEIRLRRPIAAQAHAIGD